jgi:hypothetical protein
MRRGRCALPDHSILFLETGAGAVAIRGAHLAVVRADLRHRSIAPTMADVFEFFSGSGKHFICLRGDVHFLRPKMFAEIWVHGSGDLLNR